MSSSFEAMLEKSGPNPAGGWAAFGQSDFLRYQVARFCIVVAMEMQSVAIGWQVYEITKRPMDLGFVGLAQFLPGILLFLFSGHAADRFERRKVLMTCYAGFTLCSGLLFSLALRGSHSVSLIYCVLVVFGTVRAFNMPAGRAILPQLVAKNIFPNAVAWNASVFQAATILGPALGGVVYAIAGPAAVYVASASAAIGAFMVTMWLKVRGHDRMGSKFNPANVLAGLSYVWRKKLILGLISLDMFAVLLGGAVALLPVYAREILKTGPWGLGLLRSAPGIGAAAMAIFLAYRPVRRNVGTVMLWCVAGFGVFTIVFGISHSLPLSLASLLLVGATDMVSVVIRGTLVQVATPDEMRGRVGAVDMIFIGTSNEFGQFESGLTAQWFGTVPAVLIGGIGTLIVVGLWAWIFPELRQAEQMTEPEDRS
jgi:MFS family permease